MQGPYNESYQPLGDLRLTFPGGENVLSNSYERTLDLDRAVATVRYRDGNATFTREIFSSFPDQVIVVRLTCDKPAKINFSATANSLLHHATEAGSANTLILQGKAPSHVDPNYLGSANPIIYDTGTNAEGMTFNLHAPPSGWFPAPCP